MVKEREKEREKERGGEKEKEKKEGPNQRSLPRTPSQRTAALRTQATACSQQWFEVASSKPDIAVERGSE